MREIIKQYTTDELNVLLNIITHSDSMVDKHADWLYAVVDELMKRGEVTKTPDHELNALIEVVKTKVLDKPCSTSPHPLEKHIPAILADAEQERNQKRQHRSPFTRTLATVACVLVLILLFNAVSLASGHDFLGSLSHWTKDALYFVTGIEYDVEPTKTVNQEYVMLNSHLAELGITIDLPTVIQDGFYFENIESISESDPITVIAWFKSKVDYYFSIKIKWIGEIDDASFFEANGKDDMESYSNRRGNYLVTTNKDKNVAIWHQNGYEVHIQGNISYDELIQMINSIGK